MNKKIVLCGLIFSSFMFGMEQADKQLKLSCRLKESATTRSFFPITFEVPQADLYFSYIRSTMINPCNTPNDFKVLLSHNGYVRLDIGIILDSRTYLHDGTYSDSILDKQQTIKVLKKFFSKNRTENNNPIPQILMTVNSPDIEQHSLLFETSELPQPIKDACNITSLSRADVRNYYILIPMFCVAYALFRLA